MNLYLTRHGRTQWNHLRKIQGRTDIPLDEEGIKQAQATRDILNGISFNMIITSPLTRAKQTAEIINELHNANIIEDERVIERGFGEFEGSSIVDMDFSNFWHPELGHLYPTCEDVNDFYKRIYEFIDEARIKYKDKNILVVAHGGVSLPFYVYSHGLPEANDFRPYMLNNCEVIQYIFDEE